MKGIKGFITHNLGSLLLLLIISLSFMVIAKSFAEKELLVSAAREAIIEGIANSSGLSEEEKDALTSITKDKDTASMIKKTFDNFFASVTDDNYNLSNEDYDSIMEYIIKFKDEMNILGDSDYTEDEIRDVLSYDEVNDIVKESFDDIDGDVSSKDANKAVSIYKKITSINIKIVIIVSMIVIILLISLINWDLFKWMSVTGADLVISGVFFVTLYILGLVLRNKLNLSETLMTVIKNININVLLYTAILELILGIVMLVVYRFIKRINS